MIRAIVLTFSLISCLPVCAMAQTQDGGADNRTALPLVTTLAATDTPAYVAPQVEHLLGDWGGAQTYLQDHGIYLRLNAVAEFAGNTGGAQQGATSANQIAFSADVDWQKLAKITGLSTHLILVNRSGANDSHLFGDNVSPVQEIYGAGGDVAVHLVSAFAELALIDSRVDIAAGWMNVENDFASSALYCNYMNNALCGDPKALPGGDIGHSAFPDAVWAGRIRVRPTPDSYVTVGVYEVNQDLYGNADRSGFEFSMPRASGVYLPIQIGYEPKIGGQQMPGHYALGFGYDTSRFTSFSAALPTSAGVPVSMRNGNTQFWVLADQMLVRNGKGDQDGIIALGAVVANDATNSPYAQQYIGGLLDRGFWRARPEDTVGVLFTYLAMSGPLGKVQAQQMELGIPVSNSATGVQTNEMIFEANYNIHVFRGVDFRPEFQYVIRPNAQADIRNAAVFGFKASVEF